MNVALQTILRLTDLPPGYALGDEECERADRETSELEHTPASVKGFIDQNRLEGCIFKYSRIFRARGQGPSAKDVASVSVVAPDPAVAGSAATLVPELIAAIAGEDGYTEIAPPEKLGEETRLFHIPDPAGQEDLPAPATALFWRDGRILAGLLVSHPNAAVVDQLAFSLAHLQQAHIDSPTPHTEAERDDSLVELDDPSLRAPVYWLGPIFAPSHGLPTGRPLFALFLRLDRTSPELALHYSPAITLVTWAPAAWARFSTGKVERRDWTWHCTRSRRVKLRQGHAVVYAAYAKNFARCPNRPPRHYFAHVFLPGAVVGINQSTCSGATCAPFYSRAHGSFLGMAAIARHLRVRPPRTR